MAELRSRISLTDRISQTLNRIQSTMNRVNNVSQRVNQTVSRTSGIASRTTVEINELGHTAQRTGGKISRMWDSFKGYLGTMFAIQVVKQSLQSLFGVADEYASMQARIGMINDGQQTNAALQEKIYQSAQRSRSAYIGVANSVAKLNMLAGETFKSNDESIVFLETMNKAFALSGANTMERNGAMTQLTQALASGKLQGDELRSLAETAPMLTKAIADYMGVSKGEIKKLGSEGKITADIVKNAMLTAGEEIEKKFNQMPQTIGSAWQMFKNYAVRAFQPIFDLIQKGVNSEGFRKFVSVGAYAINLLVKSLMVLFRLVGKVWQGLYSVGKWVADSWSLIGPVIIGVVAALSALRSAQIAYNAIQVVTTALTTSHSFAESIRAAKIAMAAGATFTATVAQRGFNAALLACPITWIVLGIIALIGVIYWAVAAWNHFTGASVSATGVVVGAVYAMGASIANVFIFLWDITLMVIEAVVNTFLLGAHLISLSWYGLKVVFFSVLEFLANIVIDIVNFILEKWNDLGHAMNEVFYNVGKGVAKVAEAVGSVVDGLINTVIGGIEGLINSALNGINDMIDLINKIPGVDIGKIGNVTLGRSNIAGASRAWGDSMSAPVKATAKKLERISNLAQHAGTVPEAPKTVSFGKREYLDIGKAFDSGYKVGQDIEQFVGNFFNGESEVADSIQNLEDLMSGANSSNPGLGALGNPSGGKLDSVGKIEDEIDVSDEFIKLVKDVAEMKWQQNFITLKPEIVNNIDTINDVDDYDDFVSKFNDDILNAVENAAHGL